MTGGSASLLPLMAHYFGWLFVTVLALLIVAFAFVSGAVVMLLERRWTLLRRPSPPRSGGSRDEVSNG